METCFDWTVSCCPLMFSVRLWAESCEEMEVREEVVSVSEGEEVGVAILRTYVAGTNPCLPFSSTFHQSYNITQVITIVQFIYVLNFEW